MSRRRRIGVAGVVAIALVATAAGCSKGEDQVPSIGYAIDNVLTTYNANTVDGAASGARQAFARVLPGLSYLGPEGRALADGDVGTVTAQPGDGLSLLYKVNPNAVYSDGVPVTCDDLVLAWAAGSGRFTGPDQAPLFHAASRAGYSDIDRVECRPGTKDATVVFRPGRAFAEWRALFGATELMPAHVAARAAGVPDVVTALQGEDTAAAARVAAFWNTGWNLTEGELDPAVFPSAGPYRAQSYSAEDGLVLVANDKWWGNRPATDRIVVWPKGVDLEEKMASGDVDVLDVGAGSIDGFDPGKGFSTVHEPSRSSEQLVLATGGVLGSADARRALASCVPRQQLFDTLGHPGYAPQSGLGSGVLNSRIVQADTLLYPPVAAVAGDRYLRADTGAASAALSASGQGPITVRVGYLAPDARRAATVAAIAAACSPAGITVQDNGSADFTPSALAAGKVDAVLGGTASAQGAAGADSLVPPAYSLAEGEGSNFGQFRNGRVTEIAGKLAVETGYDRQLGLATEAENILWSEMPSIPLFNEPRTTAFADGMHAAVPNPTAAGAGWNMDRWILLR
ncbi:ABC transporter substrate-binding protein [Rhodococcus tukisamuensis]|uniref:Peptide/nickel transport system substrate-binding protein n=1 Tax=Rhodococcus tukisamuensis TaxID=168276 RepID=A0A1G6QQH3_9NOCA|nr:ABC transporter substrate-binding protein [Rhodococcus tukisamuensis]SDC94224.1 peptide/nickel transport system substrate-binding protein [Rhodococcus tukisamuensis]